MIPGMGWVNFAINSLFDIGRGKLNRPTFFFFSLRRRGNNIITNEMSNNVIRGLIINLFFFFNIFMPNER